MSDKFQDRYRIPSARAQWWDYGNDAAYFITICSAGKDFDFGKIINRKMILSKLGLLAETFWFEITNHFHTVELGAFIVMPNHVHGLLMLTGNKKKEKDVLNGLDVNTNDDCSTVETRHALSLLNPDLDANDNERETRHALSLLNPDGDANDNERETRHALSLQPRRQNSFSPGQNRFRNQGKKTISSIVGSYKSVVSKNAHRLGINFDWQPRFYDHIIRTDSDYQRISTYIRNNISKWEDDQFYYK
jgi:hypothetical protein